MGWEGNGPLLPGTAHGADGDKLQTAVDSIAEIKAMLYVRLTDATELQRSIQVGIDTV